MLGVCWLGCNMLTGAEGLELEDDRDDGSPPADTGGPDPEGSGDPEVVAVPADGVWIDEIAVFQSVKSTVMRNGAPVRPEVPLVVGRAALFRVYYHTDASHSPTPVLARLTFADAAIFEQEVILGAVSAEDDLASTINFHVPGEHIQFEQSFRVELVQPPEVSSGSHGFATYPLEASEPLEVYSTQGGLNITLVPIRYTGDGSGRLPDTSPAQIDAYRLGFEARYPVPAVNITLHEPVTWAGPVRADGGGWGMLLNSIADLRADEGAPHDVYYYGIFSPADSLGSYCGSGCVAGLGFVAEPTDSWSHTAIGLGFSGYHSVETALHELGHNHGRNHAPCGGAESLDPDYPHGGASIGTWGYNPLTGLMVSPSMYTDMMGYCDPTWISDYTYVALFHRVATVNGAAQLYVPPGLRDRTYDRVQLGADGSLSWLEPMKLERPPAGVPTEVELVRAGQPEAAMGQLFRYDHLPGGVLFIAQAAPIESLTMRLEGRPVSLLGR